MNYRVELSNQAKKALSSGVVNLDGLMVLLDKFVSRIEGEDLNVDWKKLGGIWRGYYRLRTGDMRVIIRADFKNRSIYVKKIGPRGDVYK